jgi:hypothetical protein
MTINEALQKAAGEIDDLFERNIEDAERMVCWHGGTELEVEDCLLKLRADLAESRARVLADLEKWLRRDGAPLH